MEAHRYKILTVLFSLSYWMIDSTIHVIGFGESEFEFIPSDINELWMRSGICLMLILLGAYADHHTREILQKEEEKKRIFHATLRSSHHILNNFLQQMQIFHLEAEQSRDFDKTLLPLYDQIIDQTLAQIKELESLEELTESDIERTGLNANPSASL